MKNKIIYVFLFLIAFLFTTGGVVFLNSIFKDIFKYDFRLATISDTTQVTDSTKILNAALTNSNSDSLKTLIPGNVQDSLHASNSKDSTSADSSKRVQNILKSADYLASNGKAPDSVQIATNTVRMKPDSSYIIWMKQTAKMYESMDPKKAAKIIQSYSDNIARDIIYSMKQKKAAEILSELNPDTANRITRAKSNAF